MDLGKHLNVMPSKQEAVISSSFLYLSVEIYAPYVVGQKNVSGKPTTVESNERRQLGGGGGLCKVYLFDASSSVFFLNQVRN